MSGALDALSGYSLFGSFTRNTATVFMLHEIGPSGGETARTGALSSDLLETYLSYLDRHGYRVISLQDYVEALRAGGSTKKAVVFTVDDGHRTFYEHGYPQFRRRGLPVTVFLVSDFIEKAQFLWWQKIELALASTDRPSVDLTEIGGRQEALGTEANRKGVAERITDYCKRIPNAARLELVDRLVETLGVECGQPRGRYAPLSWDEVGEMQRNGVEFQPHTKTHPILSQMSRAEVLAELGESRQIIEARTGRRAEIFCYPNGTATDFSDETIDCLRETGYRAAVTSMAGFDGTKRESDLFRLKRHAVPFSFAVFKQYVSGVEALKETLRSRLR